jgi:hypothetical protein
VEIRRGSWDDFDAVYALAATPQSKPEHLRSRWQLPSFDPARHLWLAEDDDGAAVAYGALYAPDGAVVQGDRAHAPALLAAIEAQARAEGFAHLSFVLPEGDAAERAYLEHGFRVATTVLEMEADLSAAAPAPSFPTDVTVRTYTPEDARSVQALLDDAYTWGDEYVPLAHEDWVAWMTGDASFDPTCWWLAEAGSELAGAAHRSET